MAQPRTRRRERDLTPREYARRYQEAYGPPSNPLVALFWIIFYGATFVLMLIAIQAALFNLFKVDPFDWIMTRMVGPSHVQIGPAPVPTAIISIQPQQPAVVVPQQPQEQPAAPQPQPVPTAVPQEQPALVQGQQAPFQEQAAPAQAQPQPTVVPTAHPTSIPTIAPTAVVTIKHVEEPLPSGWGGGGAQWTVGTPTPADGGGHW